MHQPASPTNSKKRTPGSFLLKFAVGKSVSTNKREDSSDSANSRSSDLLSPPPLAQPQFTAAGRKYFAIKVDYPYLDDKSISERPLLSGSPTDPRSETRSELDYHEIMTRKKHHRLSSVLASDTSMEFLVDGNSTDQTPRSSGPFSSYPGSRNRYSMGRSNSMSELMSPTGSFHDESSILPGDSVSMRPAQVVRGRANSGGAALDSANSGHIPGSISTSIVRSPSATTVQDNVEGRNVTSAIPLSHTLRDQPSN
jgi:hypothetical protein